MSLDIFIPSLELLERTGDPTGHDYVAVIIPSFDDETDFCGKIIAGLVAMIRDYYRPSPMDEKFVCDFSNLASDLIRNAAIWGNKCDPTKKVAVGLWFGEKGILLAIRDEGNFFVMPEVKEQLESRIPIEPDWSDGCDHGGVGTVAICEADYVFVSTETNTLYVFSRKF